MKGGVIVDEKTLRVAGCELHYWIKFNGSKKWIFFFHGAGCTHDMFEKQVSAMPDEYNVLVWDARGHGKSKLDHGRPFDYDDMIQDFIELADFHQMDDITVIGQSMGANLSQSILQYFPERIKKTVLIDCTNNAQNLTISEKMQIKLFSPIIWALPWKNMVNMSAKSSGESEYTHKYIKEALESIGKRRFSEIMNSIMDKALNPLPNYCFPIPVLLILGEKDKTGNIVKSMTNWPKKDKNAILKIVPNAGHNANMDSPEYVNRLIVDYLTNIKL